MMLTATVRWHVGDVELDPRVLQMLRAIARRGSLAQAIQDVGLSYRHAWGLLGRCESLLGQRLVTLERGRGARLTAGGRRLAEASAACDRELAPELTRWAAEVNRNVRRPSAEAKAVVVRASHDIALAQLRDLLARSRTVSLQLAFEASLDALGALARYQCDVAGFHVPVRPAGGLGLQPFRPLLADPALCIVHFADREQGLMVAPGNPKGIRGIRDIARRRARFVNRQPGSGTRLLFDQLLSASGVRAGEVHGYHSEEFTHAAVAATVASGMADCAFGIEAAAKHQRLDFVPVATERYYLAMRRSALERPCMRAVLAALSGTAFRRVLKSLPGYRAPARVEPVDAQTALL